MEECLVFITTLKQEVSSLKESFATLEMASNKLMNNTLLSKLVSATLKTGNRMNDGIYRGGGPAFKLDTLLKLANVKGIDGRTTLLQFVVQEIIRWEGIKVARATFKSDDFILPIENVRALGFQVVSGLSIDLEVMEKAAVVDFDRLTSTTTKLGDLLLRAKDLLNKVTCDSGEKSRFHLALKCSVEELEVEVTSILRDERRITDLVKTTEDYFQGNYIEEKGLRLFVIVRDFMVLLDNICADIEQMPEISSCRSFRDEI